MCPQKTAARSAESLHQRDHVTIHSRALARRAEDGDMARCLAESRSLDAVAAVRDSRKPFNGGTLLAHPCFRDQPPQASRTVVGSQLPNMRAAVKTSRALSPPPSTERQDLTMEHAGGAACSTHPSPARRAINQPHCLPECPNPVPVSFRKKTPKNHLLSSQVQAAVSVPKADTFGQCSALDWQAEESGREPQSQQLDT